MFTIRYKTNIDGDVYVVNVHLKDLHASSCGCGCGCGWGPGVWGLGSGRGSPIYGNRPRGKPHDEINEILDWKVWEAGPAKKGEIGPSDPARDVNYVLEGLIGD